MLTKEKQRQHWDELFMRSYSRRQKTHVLLPTSFSKDKIELEKQQELMYISLHAALSVNEEKMHFYANLLSERELERCLCIGASQKITQEQG